MTIAHGTRSISVARATPLRLSPSFARLVVAGVVIVACVGGALATGGAAEAAAVLDAGEDLTRLLRAMAAIKAVMALGAVAAILWRLGAPVGPARLAAYGAACCAMSAGPGLIWGMAHVGMGALLLHAGLLAGLVMVWRDPASALRLQALLAARRAHRGAPTTPHAEAGRPPARR